MTRKELMKIMPANGDDLEAAKRIVALGFPTVGPVMRDMVNWMRVAQSPVADTFAAFFAELAQPAVGVIGDGLMRENCWLRHRIFSQVLPKWPADVIRQLTTILTTVATQPDAYDSDLSCVDLLVEHRLADLEWVRQWLDFKRERWSVRNDLLKEAEERLKSVQQGAADVRPPAAGGRP
jgi:hypothetical protein